MKLKVLVITHSLPFYHIPFWMLLGSHPDIELTVTHGTDFFTGPLGVPEGVYEESMPFKIRNSTITHNICGKSILWHGPALSLVKREFYDVVIHQFEMKFLSIWKTRTIVKNKQGKFILWGIGQSLKATPLLDVSRKFLAHQADAVIFYSDTNRKRFSRMGLNPQRLFVARNSIDLEPIDSAIERWPAEKVQMFKHEHNIDHGPVLLHVGRLMARKRLDLLIKATQILRSKHQHITSVLIGNGPDRERLETMVRANSLENHFRFLGTISDEEHLAPWFLSSDIVVAPAQTGHLATHAHAYGRPLIISSNRKIQGPEVDILIHNKTGIRYRHGDVNDLVKVITELLDDSSKGYTMRIEARQRAHDYSGITRMANGLIEAISYVTQTSLQKFE